MTKTCSQCGNTMDDAEKFCTRCGANANVEPQPVNPNPSSQPVTYAQQTATQPTAPTMSLGSWIGTILLTTCLGLISFILLIVWGFSSDTPEPKKTYCKAAFVVHLILVVFSILIMIFAFSFFATLAPQIIEEIEYALG